MQFLCGAWSYTRPSVLFTAAADGSIYVWDILVQRSSPVINFQVPLLAGGLACQTKSHGIDDADRSTTLRWSP